MKPASHDRRREHSPNEEFQGIAARSLRERVPVDELELREADVERVDELRAGAKAELLAMAGYTTEKAATELTPVALEMEETKQELSPEQVEAKWLDDFKSRFEALPELHKGIQWADVERSLKADPEAMRKLQALDEKGHAMNVFGEEKGEFIFASGWDNYEEVAAEHKNITYDLEGQKLAEKSGYKPNGNAVDIAKELGVDLSDPNFHEMLRKAVQVNGWAWLKTDASTRKAGDALNGYNFGIYKLSANHYNVFGSFCAALRVKKA